MERKLEHFEERLDKDQYSKEEVAKLLNNEAEYSTRISKKEFEGYVSKEEFDSLNDSFNQTKAELQPYKEKEFDSKVSTVFKDLNGSKDRIEDFKKLTGVKPGMDLDQVKESLIQIKESGNYNFLFNASEPEIKIKPEINTKPKQKAMITNFTPKSGWASKLFKK